MRAFILPLVLGLWGASSALALETIYIIRHADKETGAWWDQSKERDAYRPLTCEGRERAERWADFLEGKGIVQVYTSTAIRTMHTGTPLAARLDIPLTPDPRSAEPRKMKRFLRHLERQHPGPGAVLVVGHSNTIPDLLRALEVTEPCYEKVGIGEGGRLIFGYDGLWTVDLEKWGCEGSQRSALPVEEPSVQILH